MKLIHGVYDSRRWVGHPQLGLMLIGMLAASVYAEDRYYVMRDGRKVPLVQSDSEFGVIFRSRTDVAAAKARLEASGRGTLEDIEGATNARVKIFRVEKITDARRTLLRQDPAVQQVSRVYRFAGSTIPVISTGRLVVKLRSDIPEDQRKQLWEEYQLENVEAFKGLHDVYTATVTGDNGDEVLRAEQLAADARTMWAHPDFLHVIHRRQVTPSDTFFDRQWHLNNTGQTQEGIEDADIDAPEAWALGAEGEGVLFGMLDDGCDVDHEDLRGNYIGVGQDFILPEGASGFDDPRPKFPGNNHGTAVMGLAVASGNGVGVRGVSFRSRFTVSRGLGQIDDEHLDPQTGSLVAFTQLARAYPFALEQGVDIHINSWGPPQPIPVPPILEDAIETAFLEGRDPDGEGGQDPLGMVIVFATGNSGRENEAGFEPSTLPTVIGVGASSDKDERAPFSDFGPELHFLAPGAADIATTDNEDDRVDLGFNVGGISSDIDPSGKYTGRFSGTSAACPIAAGIAGLILSVNPQLTATNVRIIMEHTCDKVSPDDALYNGITNRSLTYGYGRVNAQRAVLAAQDSLENGNRTWPDVPTDVSVFGSTLRWRAGTGTDEFLVGESPGDFRFIPEDGVCYDTSQLDCASSTPVSLPANVSVFFVGCNGDCATSTEQIVDFERPEFGRTFFAIYGRSSSGRYSFGVPVDSLGDTTGGSGGAESVQPPVVTITASPLEGESPLLVRFNGNAITDVGIDASKTAWDFDVEDDVVVDATTPQASYTYIVNPGETRRFTAKLTMVDVLDNEGTAGVQIRVMGPVVETRGDTVQATDINIQVESEARLNDLRCQTDVCGASPFEVVLRVGAGETDTPVSVQSVVWDLGDGSGATSQSVFHTYVNTGDAPLVIPVSATVTIMTSAGPTLKTATKLITVLPGVSAVNLEDPQLPGTEVLGGGGRASPCGVLGLMPLFFTVASLLWLRRSRVANLE